MPGATSAIRVNGLRDLNRAFAKTDKDIRVGLRSALREVAEPVRADAERLAAAEIKNINEDDKWSKMRVGVTRTLVYVAPKERGAKGRVKTQRYLFGLVRVRGPLGKHRPNLAPLLADRAMQPALDQNEDNVERAMQHVIDTAADRFNR